MKRILILVVACSLLFSCSNTSPEEKFELIQSVDSVFTLKNYYKEKFNDVSDPDYVNVFLSMKVYESNQVKTLSPEPRDNANNALQPAHRRRCFRNLLK